MGVTLRPIGSFVNIQMGAIFSDPSRAFAVGDRGKIVGYQFTTEEWKSVGRTFDYAVEVAWTTPDGERHVTVIPVDEWELGRGRFIGQDVL